MRTVEVTFNEDWVTADSALIPVLSSKHLCGQYDHNATTIAFVRPANLVDMNLVLLFAYAQTRFEPVPIALENEYLVPSTLTGSPQLSMQCLFQNDDGTIVAHSTIVSFTLSQSFAPAKEA